MQLAITVLGTKTTNYLPEVLTAVSQCYCSITELRSSHLADTTATYCLIEGNWNHIAKLENMLESLQHKLSIQIQMHRPEAPKQIVEGLTYALETMSLFRRDVVQEINEFLSKHKISIEELNASRYVEPYTQNTVFMSRFIILIPPSVRLITLREEFLDFCETLNLDAILEPIKR
jgi:glycine cleavage system transcriptional repressor